MKRAAAVAPVLIVCAATGCDGGPSKIAPEVSAAERISDATSATVSTPSQLPAADAASIAKRLQSAGLPMTGVIVYDATTDPNAMLGRPGGYTSKASWADSRVGNEPGTTDGGTVEVFPTEADATNRSSYIASVTKGLPMLAEYRWQSGAALIRVTHMLTPEQAERYHESFG